MEYLLPVIRVLFVLFLIYTMLYLIQWGIGLCVAVWRLSAFQTNQRRIRRILPDAIAREYPVSVIIPAHNEEACICETVESLLGDDYPGLQILVVDDGSTDQTAQQLIDAFELEETVLPMTRALPTKEVLGTYAARWGDKHLGLIRKANGGKSDALNCGLNACTSPYCVMLDADTQVVPGSIRILAGRFLTDPKTIVCAGAIGSNFKSRKMYTELSIPQKCLVRFQQMEYFRTFYMQRLLFEQVNANVIVSGAFAMFDAELLRSMGGYRLNTIGEDMEITMRLHAFCASQKRPYRIAYTPEAQCYTQFPFRYRDFIRQRRRWHIGMIQSFHQHVYMLGNRFYGWAGFIAGVFLMLYEFLSPFIELLGLLTLAAAYFLDILDFGFAWKALLIYLVLSILNLRVLLQALCRDHVVELSFRDRTVLTLVALLEFGIFHPINTGVKFLAVFMRGHHRKTWEDIHRTGSGGKPAAKQT